ncbi:DUF1385 domain-containing protein [Zhaonella formicivorans]|uniref:DUF1385 domain-containing protein n=1 Tax=Zhaonella formicivorans TaxID=2528593 RepID=UPI0010E622DC|nr:DUF1385 domain-containing protein [Zhaonella formicivorans]
MPEPFQYGGQAVIEGVMMRGPKEMAVAVRKQAGDIVIDTKPINSLAQKYPFLKWPLLRGVLALFEAMVIGVKVLTYSANMAFDEEEETLSGREIAFTVFLAVGLAVLLFVIIPAAAAFFLKAYVNTFWQNILEGVLRIAIFLGYVLAIGRMSDVQRVFQYHGAEHKVIHAYEAGEKLTVDNARKYTTLHPRCGTSFMLFVLVLTIFLFSFLHTPDILSRIASRLLLLPVVAGLGYEFIKWSGKYACRSWVKAIIAPGLWLQKLTTREPDDSQLEVAICALEAVLARDSTC